MGKSKIEWTDKTWNPALGCTKVSEGCKNCYAERLSKRFKPGEDFSVVTTHPERLKEPLRWKKPCKIFVCSMSDLFHEDVPDEFIDEVFTIMLASHVYKNVPAHKFLILTKRPERMKDYFSVGAEILLRRWADTGDGWLRLKDADMFFSELIYSQTCHDWDKDGRNTNGSPYKPWGYLHQLWPLPNVWLGVTAENQEQTDRRISILLQIPAAKRFVSVEPMLGEVDLWGARFPAPGGGLQGAVTNWPGGLDWVICGGESGPGARPMHPDWVRKLRDQCTAAGVPFFFKQWGEWKWELSPLESKERFFRVGKKNAGRELDGKIWDEAPTVAEKG